MAAAPVIDDAYLKEVDALRADLKAFLTGHPSRCLLFLRLALNDSLEWCKTTKTGGANGSVRSERELKHAANAGLPQALQNIEELKARHGPVTFADTIALGGLIAAELLGCPTLAFVPGRRDSRVAVPEGRLPSWAKLKEDGAGTGKLREILERVGLPIELSVALLGLHPYGTTWEDPLAGEAAPGAYKISNEFFKSVTPAAPAGSPAALLAADPQLLAIAQHFAANNDAYLSTVGHALERATLLGTALAVPSGSVASGVASSATGASSGGMTTSTEEMYSNLMTYAVAGVAVMGLGVAAIYLMRKRRRERLRKLLNL